MSDIAQKIVKTIPRIRDPKGVVLYNREWRNATHQVIEDKEWFNPVTKTTINERQDVFSQRCCLNFDTRLRRTDAESQIRNGMSHVGLLWRQRKLRPEPAVQG